MVEDEIRELLKMQAEMQKIKEKLDIMIYEEEQNRTRDKENIDTNKISY